MNDIVTACCIVGGGPAGMMTGYLLARAGVPVTVLEKHADFLRDFRGDTIHPSTLQLMDELGLYSRLLDQPHHKSYELRGRFGSLEARFADFSHLPTRAKFIAFMPQWDFLNFLVSEAKAYPCFTLMMRTEAMELIGKNGRIEGVIAKSPEGPVRILSQLVIGCDGRHAMTRAQSGLSVEDIGAPMDVLWFRLSRRDGDPDDPIGSFGSGHIFVMIGRGDYWQCGYVIAKGSLDKIRERGLAAFRNDLEKLAPFLKGRSTEVASFEDIQTSHRRRGPAQALAPAGPSLHRRRSTHHVAHRRRWHQPRDPGRGGCGKPSRGAPERGACHGSRSRAGPSAARAANAPDAMAAGAHTEQRDPRRARKYRCVKATVPATADEVVSMACAHPRPRPWARLPAGACGPQNPRPLGAAFRRPLMLSS